MKNGFTLIELLGVIIILAAVLTITVPIVSELIRNGKNEIKKESIDLYGKAAKQAVLLYESENKVSPKTFEDIEPYILYNGDKVSCQTKILNVDKSIYISDCSVNNKLIKDYSHGKQICKKLSGDKNTLGSKYECEVAPGTKYNFYVLSFEDDGTTNLIMDRNICDDGTAATEDKPCFVPWISKSDYGCNSSLTRASYGKGPITSLEYLKRATNLWINTNEMIIEKFNSDTNMFFDIPAYNTYARMPYYDEIQKYDGSNAYLYENLNDSSFSYPNGQLTNSIQGILGYWTLSIQQDSAEMAYYIYLDGNFYSIFVDFEEGIGIRPVINMQL